MIVPYQASTSAILCFTAKLMLLRNHHNYFSNNGNGWLTLFSYSDAWRGERALSLQDLQVLSTIEEISGSLIIEPLGNVPNITSIDWLPNLRKVGGAEV